MRPTRVQPSTADRSRRARTAAAATIALLVLTAGGAFASPAGGGRPTSAASVALVSHTTTPPAASDRLDWPLRGEITGRFGESRGGHRHAGIDLPRTPGTTIRAAGDGRVVMREWQDGYGNYTCIAHRTITSCYAHQSRFRVKRGERVQRGQVIGTVGDTGTSYAPHLHFEVRRGVRPWGKPVNPVKYLPRVE